MSIKAMHWAWTITLAPAPKFVLMALADHADESGVCWPHVELLARKCCMSHRSVQRALRRLRSAGLLRVEAQFRRNGSQRSNYYRLAIDCAPGDKLTRGASNLLTCRFEQPPGDKADTPPCHPCHPRDDSRVMATDEPSVESSEEPERRRCSTNQDEPESESFRSADKAVVELVLPSPLSAVQRDEIAKLVKHLDQAIAQQVLDELAGRLAQHRVRDPVRYCHALVNQVHTNRFQPRRALAVAQARSASRDGTRNKSEAPGAAEVPGRSVPVSSLPPDLHERIERMRSRAKDKTARAPDGHGSA